MCVSSTSPKPGQFIYSSIIPAPLEKVWALYANVYTINKISPPWARVNFERIDLPLRAGSEIIFVGKYPPRLRWHAKIESFVSQSHFVDIQISGPFAVWRHEHLFKSHGGNTEMIDQVMFRVKGGDFFNKLFSPLLKMLLQAYFASRHRRTRILLRK